MSSKDKEMPPGDNGADTPDTPKRPARTIDLEAEEVRLEAGDAAVPEGEAGDAQPREAEIETEDRETAGRTGSVPDHKPPEDSDERGKPPPPPQRTKPSDVKSFVTHLAAGLVGGLIGVVGAGVGLDKLSIAGLTGGPSGSEKTAQFEERLDEVATAVQEQSKAISALPGEAAIGDIKKRLSAIEAKPAPEAAVPSGLGERLAKLEETLKTLQQAGSDAGATGIGQSAVLVARLDGFETELEKRYAALEEQIAETKSGIAEAAARPAVSGHDKAALEALAERLDGLEKKLEEVASRPAQTPVAADGKAAGLALAFQALRRAAGNGEAFRPQLAALEKLAGKDIGLKPLSGMADKGVASRAALLTDLPGVLGKARSVVSRPKDETFLDRLASNAQAVVRVRRIGPAAGTDTSAVLSRMEAAANTGDIKAIVKEADQLDGEAADTVAPWLEKAKARVALDTAVMELETRLLTDLGGGNGGQR